MLTKDDWVEIYYALDSKARRIERGDYGEAEEDGDGVDPEEWARHLREIQEKIGPDGQKKWPESHGRRSTGGNRVVRGKASE